MSKGKSSSNGNNIITIRIMMMMMKFLETFIIFLSIFTPTNEEILFSRSTYP